MRRTSNARWLLWCALWLLLAALIFYGRGYLRAGQWPAPLDDTYIYYGHARSAALGSPFEWYPGNGYSSGATSVLYPLLLAPGWAIGLRGPWLGLFAAAIAWLSLFDLCRSLGRLFPDHLVAGGWRWLLPLALVAVPLLNWSWFSGMEVAWLAAVIGRSLLASQRASECSVSTRRRMQLQLGGWLALLVLTRPEMVVLAFALVIATSYGARSLGTWSSLFRCGMPALTALLGHAAVNRALTGEWSQAGAVRKLLLADPFREPQSIAIEVLKNLLIVFHQAFVRALGGWLAFAGFALLALTAVYWRRSRRLAVALWIGGIGGWLLLSLNATARYQNFRYAAPSLLLFVLAALLGLAAWSRRAAWLTLALGGLLFALPLGQLPRQLDHFAQASRNIAQQHGVMAARLRALQPPPQRVLLNDAGAIPYLAEIPPLDGLGLGGYRAMPFARASVQGIPAVIELIERLPVAERPDYMAIYPGWWGSLPQRFGTRVDAVTIMQNVICAADEKVLLRADWSLLEADPTVGAAALDHLDVGDLLDEREHGYRFGAPRSGQLREAVHGQDGRPRWDAGRRLPRGSQESFELREGIARQAARLWLRADNTAPNGADDAVDGGRSQGALLRLTLVRAGRTVDEQMLTAGALGDAGDQWRFVALPLANVVGGDRIVVRSEADEWRSYEYWLLPAAHKGPAAF